MGHLLKFTLSAPRSNSGRATSSLQLKPGMTHLAPHITPSTFVMGSVYVGLRVGSEIPRPRYPFQTSTCLCPGQLFALQISALTEAM